MSVLPSLEEGTSTLRLGNQVGVGQVKVAVDVEWERVHVPGPEDMGEQGC